jgi:hypothetical protein
MKILMVSQKFTLKPFPVANYSTVLMLLFQSISVNLAKALYELKLIKKLKLLPTPFAGKMATKTA